MTISINTVVEAIAVALVVVFWWIVWWPLILPTVAFALLACTADNQ